MRYCIQCVLPDTRPNLSLDNEGVCNACRMHEKRASIDWEARQRSFAKIARNAKARSTGYDCIIPVSGGKDSYWQVLTCLEHGLTPLAVTWRTPGRTKLGQKNLDNLVALGVDHVDYRINPEIERRFTLKAFARYGTPGLPMHMALFNIPMTLAVRLSVPLVVWGENSAFEYGCRDERDTGFRLDSKWMATYGVMHGTTARDWIDDDLPAQAMTPYMGPSDEQLEAAGVNAVFLGYHFPWTPQHSREVALGHGFQASPDGAKTGLWDFADIDDQFISIHHWMKWYKFGFTRLFDNVSIDIRNGLISRDQGLSILKQAGDQTPQQDIDAYCCYLGISRQRFFDIAETFRNTDVWEKRGGTWHIPEFIFDDWSWQ